MLVWTFTWDELATPYALLLHSWLSLWYTQQAQRAQFLFRSWYYRLQEWIDAGGSCICLESCFDHSKYHGHSFRIGAVTSAAAARIPSNAIKMLGCWDSFAYLLHVYMPPAS